MACGMEHFFVLDFAMRNTSWKPDRFGYRGYKEQTKDVFNYLAIYSDILADWLWQKSPWVRSSIDYALACARESKKAGDDLGATAKLSLACHYVADAMAVSHSWLDYIADETQFESSDVIHKYFHDPVEYPVADYIHRAQPSPAPKGASFRGLYEEAQKKAYEIGKKIFVQFFHGRPVEDLVLLGIANSAQACHALFESLEQEPELLSTPEQVRTAREKWVMRHLLKMSGEEITTRPLDKTFTAKMKMEVGYEGGAIFTDLKSCAPHAQKESLRWRKERKRWREVTMRGILPPMRKGKIGATWRPPESELAE